MLRSTEEGAGFPVPPVLTDATVRRLREELFAEGLQSDAEVEALFALEATLVEPCAAWTVFFVEAVTDFVVWQTRPTGILDDKRASWLLLMAEGTRTVNALAVLLNVLDEAQQVPGWFEGTLRQRVAQGWIGIETLLEQSARAPGRRH